MYDAINALSLPAGGDLYAGYVDGNWPSANAISQRFPHATVVRIATSSHTNDGVVGDGPPDNGSWPEWIGWVQRRRAAGVDPTMYCSLSQWPTGQAAFKAAGVADPHWWVAHYSPDATLPAGAVALQHTETAGFDISSVADYWPGVDPAPIPPAAAAVPEEDDMRIFRVKGDQAAYALASPLFWVIADEANLAAYVAAGVRQVTVDAREIAKVQAAVAALAGQKSAA
jgi:hypothetical protein